MTPLTWWDRLLWWISPWRYIQCCAELPNLEARSIAYCIRCKGHPGQHETNDGESFP